jgi:hypothetical protein
MNSDKSIIVTQTSKSHPLQFQVAVSTHGTTTEHLVTIAQPHCDSLTHGRHFAVALVEASILFLLDREPKETMLRRFDISLSKDGGDIYEIKLDEGYLMSSQFTAGEVALAERALEPFGARPIDVVVGGLGLGYSAKAALDCANVRKLVVVEAIPEVVEWHQRHLVPLGRELSQRSTFVVGDFFAMAAGDGSFERDRADSRYDAILVDIDHSPTHLLQPSNAAFYEPAGLSSLSTKLRAGGVFALWSTDRPDEDFLILLRGIFDDARAELIEFENPYQDRPAVNTIYIASKAAEGRPVGPSGDSCGRG